jgi:hypothetical protein
MSDEHGDLGSQPPAPGTDQASGSGFSRLMYRWFVEYNPTYLASALLVLMGQQLLSVALARGPQLASCLWPAAVAEVYDWTLIGGAAWLLRLRQRRAAVCLGLLAVLFSSDFALGVEGMALLPGIGVALSIGWLGSFAGKLLLLTRIFEIRAPRGLLAIPISSAAVIALLPHAARAGDSAPFASFASVAAGMVFLVGLGASLAAGRWEQLGCGLSRDEHGNKVFRRSVRLAKWVWSAQLAGHLCFLLHNRHVSPLSLVPALLTLAAVALDGELELSAYLTLVLASVGKLAPGQLGPTAAMAALVWIRFGHLPRRRELEPAAAGSAHRAPPHDVYRGEPVEQNRPVVVFEPAARVVAARATGAAMFSAYVSVWCWGWQGGALPLHSLPLDVSVSLALGALMWLRVARVLGAPLGALWLHAFVAAGLVRAPRSTLEWAMVTLGLGFAGLAGSLLTSWRLARRALPGLDRSTDPPQSIHR